MDTSDPFGPEFKYIEASFNRLINALNLTFPETVDKQHQENGEDPNTQEFKNSSSQEFNGSVSKQNMCAVIIFGVVIMIGFVIVFIAYRRKAKNVPKSLQEQMDILELGVAAECKEAFAELQTDMTDVVSGEIPFLDYRTYAMHVLFPNMEDPTVLQRETPELLRKERGLVLFGELIMNKNFLLRFIRTMEKKLHFSIRQRTYVVSLLILTLQDQMEYYVDILKILLARSIKERAKEKNHPKLSYPRTESIAETMLNSWFTFLSHSFLKECAGEPLFLLFRAVKQQIEKGPMDAITSEARYCLREENLLRQEIEFKPMTVDVSILDQAIVGGLDPNTVNVPVKVLDCDTISQVKEKALDTIYRATPYSERPSKDDFALVWKKGTSGKLILSDQDSTTEIQGEWKKRNTLQHYRVPDGACLNLETGLSPIPDPSILSEKNANKTVTLSKFSSSSPFLGLATSTLDNNDHNQGLRMWHLVKHDDNNEGERSNKVVPEIDLTRLLGTKGTLQIFVDNLFEAILKLADTGSILPFAIKYIGYFLDQQAKKRGISEPEVVHMWKTNALPLKFWVNIIQNPHFIFDVQKSDIVNSCLSIVAEVFKESYSTDDYMLRKHSLSSKFLYARDIPKYREQANKYFSDIELLTPVSDQHMNAKLARESRLHSGEFNTICALDELYTYAAKYKKDLIAKLTKDELLVKKFKEVNHLITMATQKNVIVTDL